MAITDDIKVNKEISISAEYLKFQAVRASGPGGQNVNKVATKIRLIYAVHNDASLPWEIKNRLLALPSITLNRAGNIVITSQEGRSQYENRIDALEKLKRLIKQACIKPKERKATNPTRASKENRLQSKKRHSATKKNRNARIDFDEE